MSGAQETFNVLRFVKMFLERDRKSATKVAYRPIFMSVYPKYDYKERRDL